MVTPTEDVLVWVVHVPSGEPTEDMIVGEGWFQGFVERWRKDGDRWKAFVRYWTAPGFQHLTWVDQDLVRPVVLAAEGPSPRGAEGEPLSAAGL